MKRCHYLLSLFIGSLLLGIILWRTDLSSLVALLMNVRPNMVFAAIFGIFLFHWIAAVRWKVTLRAQAISMNLVKCYCIYLSGLLAGIVTPGRVGDFTKILYLRRLGYNYGQSAVSIVVGRCLDLCLLLLVGLLGVSWYSWGRGEVIGVLLAKVSLFILIGLPLAVLFMLVLRKTKVIEVAGRSLCGRVPVTWLQQWHKFVHDWRAIPHRTWFGMITLTVGGWVVYFGAIYLLAMAMGLPLTFWEATIFIALSAIVSLLPISIAGIGTRDASLILMFGLVGLSSVQAIAFSLCILFSYVITALFGFVGYLIEPLPIGQDFRLKG